MNAIEQTAESRVVGVNTVLGRKLPRLLTTLLLGPAAAASIANTETPVELSLADLMNLQLVQSAGFFAVDRRLAPGNSYLMDRDQMSLYGLRTMSQVLNRMAPGVNISYHAFSSNTIGMRGIVVDVNAKTLLLRDNVNTNMRNHYGIQGAELQTPLTGDIDRIEVTNGPGAILHGSGAISGFINQISATGESRQGAWVRGAYGDGNAVIAEGSWGKVFAPGNDLFLYGGYYKSEGVDLRSPIPLDKYDTIAGAKDPSTQYWDGAKHGQNNGDVKLSARYRIGTDQDLVSLDFKSMYQYANLAPTAVFWNHNASQSWVRELIALDSSGTAYLSPYRTVGAKTLMIAPEFVIRPLDKTSISLTPSFLAKALVFTPTDGLKNALRFNRNAILDTLWNDIKKTNVTIAKFQKLADTSTLAGASAQFTDSVAVYQRRLAMQQARYANPSDPVSYGNGENHRGVKGVVRTELIESHKLAVGGEISQKRMTGNNTFFGDEELNLWEAPQSFDWTDYSVFAEDMMTYGPVSASVGGRYDYTQFGTMVLPNGKTGTLSDADNLVGRVALAWTVTDDHIVKGSWQQGYRFADAQIYKTNMETRLTTPSVKELKPERSNSFEAGVYSRFDGGRINLSATGFYNVYEDMIAWISEPKRTYGNATQTFTAVGGEFGADWKPIDAIKLEGSYSVSKPLESHEKEIRVANTDDGWSKFPEHMVKMGVSGKYRAFDFGMTGRFRSGTYVSDTLTAVQPGGSSKAVLASFTSPTLAEIYSRNEYTLDVAVGYTLAKDVRVAGSVENLLSNNYENLDYYGGQYIAKAGLRPESPVWKLQLEAMY